jgi:hypothetical protein
VPNPASGSAVISYSTQQPQTAGIIITDITGRKVAELANTTETSGTQQVRIETAAFGLQQGTYLVTVITNEGTVSAPLVIAE